MNSTHSNCLQWKFSELWWTDDQGTLPSRDLVSVSLAFHSDVNHWGRNFHFCVCISFNTVLSQSFCHLILQSFKWWECSTSKKLMLNTFVSSLFSFRTSWFKQFKLLPSQRWQNYSTWAHLCCLRLLSPNNRIENLHQRLYSSQYLLLPCTEKDCWNFLFFFFFFKGP